MPSYQPQQKVILVPLVENMLVTTQGVAGQASVLDLDVPQFRHVLPPGVRARCVRVGRGRRPGRLRVLSRMNLKRRSDWGRWLYRVADLERLTAAAAAMTDEGTHGCE